MRELADGLWWWTTRHPDWKPSKAGSTGDWAPEVGSFAHRAGDVLVLVDPLVADGEAGAPVWAWLDEQAAAAPGGVHVHTTISWHRRSRDAVVERYAPSLSSARGDTPAGTRPIRVRRYAETLLLLEGPRALVTGDCLLGAGATEDGDGAPLALCPASWVRSFGADRSIGELRETLHEATAPLGELALVLPSHGAPVTRDATAALRAALA